MPAARGNPISSLVCTLVSVGPIRASTAAVNSGVPGPNILPAASGPAVALKGALARFERDLIRERTKAGLAAARRGVRTGEWPKKLADPKQQALARPLHAGGHANIATIRRALRTSRTTLDRSLNVATGHLSASSPKPAQLR